MSFRLKPPVPLEKDVQKAILNHLKWNPRVAWAERFNSGRAWLKGAGGKLRPVQFNTLDGCTDIMGQLKDGRILVIEVKRPGWTHPTDAHEIKQRDFINSVTSNGGVGFFATCVEDVEARLKL